MKRDWLISIRNHLGLTQQEVADKAGVKRSTYNGYEIGRRNPSVDSAKSIAAVLGFDWTIFFADKRRDMTQKQSA